MAISDEHARAFKAEAIKRGILKPCPRCGGNQFDLQGYSFKRFSETPGDMEVVGPAFPTFLALCSNCGFVAEHAAHTLGIKIDGPGAGS
jgi:ribosomal protein S27AE